MESDDYHVRQVVEEDRLSRLPDELIHRILSCFDMKFAVQTCLLSSRWKLIWTSMPCLNFSSEEFDFLCDFAKFVTYVLSHRNPQTEVCSVKLKFEGAVNQDFVKSIANYAISRNVQELDVISFPGSHMARYPPCLFSSQSLKHFKLSPNTSACITPKIPWDFPALTTLHLSGIVLCGNLFSKCVNLKNLTLEKFHVEEAVGVFDIITHRLSDLMLINGNCSTVINLIAPQLENLTIDNCSIKHPHVSSLCFSDFLPPQLSKDQFRSLNNVTVRLPRYCSPMILYKEEDASKIINMLQELHSARYLTLDAFIVDCLSSFPGLMSHHPSPFSNLICLTIDYSMRKKDAYEVKMSSQAINFLLGNSPSATFIMKLPKVKVQSRS